ncbi:hypothetical protein [Mycoplasmopsis cynos]|uniref:hypothetical protein n=1 Tax=Mycoplasmopsis cynos TaxID=171284 RepID=UPI0022053A2B|nr:hypothetical protein [Mycoplasmopsis cynos]UWV81834.1 hypothetical protein NW065_01655 [Mycoplasmopsis cynos]
MIPQTKTVEIKMLHERIGEINNSIKLEEIKQKEAQGRLNKTKQQFPEIEEKYDFKTKEKSNIDFEVGFQAMMKEVEAKKELDQKISDLNQKENF